MLNVTGKFADSSSMDHKSDFVELVCENGQLLIRGRSKLPQESHSSDSCKIQNQCQGDSFNNKKSSSLQEVLSVLYQDFEHNKNNCRAPKRLEGIPEQAPASNGNVPLTSLKHCQVSIPTRNANWTLIPFSGSPNQNSQHEKRERANFSVFLRPQALINANHLSSGTSRPTSGLILSAAEGFKGNDTKRASTSRNADEFRLIEPASGLKGSTIKFPGCQSDSAYTNQEPSPGNNPPKACLPDEQSESRGNEGARKTKSSTNDLQDPSPSFVQNTSKRTATTGKGVEQLVTSSSVCSRGASNDLTYTLKRKNEENERYNVPEELNNCTKEIPDRLSEGTKRSRIAEVHSLSEKRRRAKINKKMRALKELIPNCSKVDKASLLDEAIEYLKALQLQVQMMAMGTAIYQPGMMLPMAMQHLNAPHLGNYSTIGHIMPSMRMQMLGGSSPLQLPHSLLYGLSSLAGITEARLDMPGFPGQVLPMSVTHSPFLFLPLTASTQYVQAADIAAASGQMQRQNSAILSVAKDSNKKDVIGKNE